MNRISAVVLLACFAVPGLARAEEKQAEGKPAEGKQVDKELAGVEAELKASFKKLKTYSAKLSSITEIKQHGMEMSMDMKGTLEGMNAGDKHLYRMDSTVTMKMPENMPAAAGGERSSLSVCDGDYTYQLTDMMGTKQANKIKADGGQLPWERMRETHELKLLPAEKVDGHDCYVVEAKSKSAGMGQPGRFVIYCRKDLGMMVKQLVYNTDGQVLNTTTITDIKVNPDIKPDRFKFVAPEGVTVMDRTGG
jgi:outer membrane lipoprotein-sorting protein